MDRYQFEQVAAERVETFVQPRRDVAREGRDARLLRGEHGDRPAGEGQAPGEHFEEHHPHGVGIGRGPDVHAGRLLGGHVRCGPEDTVAGVEALSVSLRDQAEIEQDDAPVRLDAHVAGLDVAVDLPGRVEEREPFCELRERAPQPLLPGGRRAGVHRDRDVGVAAAHVPEEVRPVDELHREEPPPAVLEQLPEPDEVRVTELHEEAKLALEAQDRPRAQLAQHLERDAGVSRQIEGLVNRPRAAFPEGAEDAEARAPAEGPFCPMAGHRRSVSDTARPASGRK